MKDLGVVDAKLGIKLINFNNKFIVTQSHYVEKLLKKLNYYEVKPILTPHDPNPCLKKNKRESVSHNKYSQLIKSLLYLSNFKRPDIVYVVGRWSRYIGNLNIDHQNALERVYRYLKGKINYEIRYSVFSIVL